MKPGTENISFDSNINPDPLFYEETVRDYCETDQEFEQIVSLWPTCPECGARRFVQCPECGFIGNLFPIGDSSFLNETGDSKESPEVSEHYCCASYEDPDCSVNHCCSVCGENGVSESEYVWGSSSCHCEDPHSLDLLICTSCDEVFVPTRFLPTCVCGHHFSDQEPSPDLDENKFSKDTDTSQTLGESQSQWDEKKVFWVSVILVLLSVAGCAYLWWIFKD